MMNRCVVVGLALAFVAVSACTVNSTTNGDPGPCLADDAEPNDGPTARAVFGTIQDDAEPLPGGTEFPTKIRRELTMHAAADVDWFDVDIRDSGAGGNPGISLIVSAGYDATAWWSCGNGTTDSVLCGIGTAVTNDPELAGKGCLTQPASDGALPQFNMAIECGGTSTDSGTLTVRVRRLVPSGVCERYSLTVVAD